MILRFQTLAEFEQTHFTRFCISYDNAFSCTHAVACLAQFQGLLSQKHCSFNGHKIHAESREQAEDGTGVDASSWPP